MSEQLEGQYVGSLIIVSDRLERLVLLKSPTNLIVVTILLCKDIISKIEKVNSSSFGFFEMNGTQEELQH